MRLRLLIPAAIAAAATYAALTREEPAGAVPAWDPPPPAPEAAPAPPPPAGPSPGEPRRETAPPPPAVRESMREFLEMFPTPEPSAGASMFDVLAGDPPASRPDAGDVDPTGEVGSAPAHTVEEGRFSISGWAAAAGHSIVSAVTFRRSMSAPVSADRILLRVDASDNVPEGGLTVLSAPGFAPDREGFTVQLVATAPGPFSAEGTYRILQP